MRAIRPRGRRSPVPPGRRWPAPARPAGSCGGTRRRRQRPMRGGPRLSGPRRRAPGRRRVTSLWTWLSRGGQPPPRECPRGGPLLIAGSLQGPGQARPRAAPLAPSRSQSTMIVSSQRFHRLTSGVALTGSSAAVDSAWHALPGMPGRRCEYTVPVGTPRILRRLGRRHAEVVGHHEDDAVLERQFQEPPLQLVCILMTVCIGWPDPSVRSPRSGTSTRMR